MSKITINDLSYHYEDHYYSVFEHVNLVFKTEWKLGLIGRNGRGKTTLLKLLCGELEPTSGTIKLPVEVEYFPYENTSKYTITLDIIKEIIGGLKTMEETMEQIISENDEARFDEYSNLQEQYLALNGYEMESNILKEVDEMKLDSDVLYREFSTLSGGERTRILLLTLFLRKQSFIVLDEPTNHLDKEGKEAVTNYLKKKKGFLIVSHDRDFLDAVIDHVVAINKHGIEIEKGTYSSWKLNKEKKEDFERRTRERLEEEIEQLERSAKTSRTWANMGNEQHYQNASHGRSNGVETYMKQAKRSEAKLEENLEEKKKLLQNYEEVKPLVIKQQATLENDILIKIKELTFQYDNNSREILKGFNYEIHTGDRIWIKGENGAGKSTLLKLITGEFSSDKIEYAVGLRIANVSQDPNWITGFIKDGFETTYQNPKYNQFLELCEYFELPEDFLERPLETMSSGEQKKINIAKALSEENHIIVLDEPLNYMDVYFSEQLETAMLQYKPTMVFVEHDGYFGKKIATRTLEL